MRRATIVAIFLVAGYVLVGASPASAATPVLGKRGLLPNGKGWGTAQPRTIFNGGSPGGLAEKIVWTHWGRATARGRGVMYAYKPEGGYFDERVPVQFRATRLGRCKGSSRRAYTRLIFRAVDRPGGAYGEWMPWRRDLCDDSAEPAECGSVGFAENSDYGAFQITTWDVSCSVARAVATASRDVTLKAGSPANYRFRARDFRCTGYSFEGEGLPTISFTCYRNTAVVTFNRS